MENQSLIHRDQQEKLNKNTKIRRFDSIQHPSFDCKLKKLSYNKTWFIIVHLSSNELNFGNSIARTKQLFKKTF